MNRHLNGKNNWVTKVKNLLDSHGFSYVFNNPNEINANGFIMIFKKTLIDCYVQTWYTDVANNSILRTLYFYINDNFSKPTYIDKVLSFDLRSCITKIRVSAHNLFIESQRYGRNRKERTDRKCTLCLKNEIEDEYHFIFICEKYVDLRQSLIPKRFYHKPSVAKLLQLIDTDNKTILVKLGQYIKKHLEDATIFYLIRNKHYVLIKILDYYHCCFVADI